MSRSYWPTPEQAIKRKKRKEIITYVLIMFGTILLSIFVTILANNLY